MLQKAIASGLELMPGGLGGSVKTLFPNVVEVGVELTTSYFLLSRFINLSISA